MVKKFLSRRNVDEYVVTIFRAVLFYKTWAVISVLRMIENGKKNIFLANVFVAALLRSLPASPARKKNIPSPHGN